VTAANDDTEGPGFSIEANEETIHIAIPEDFFTGDPVAFDRSVERLVDTIRVVCYSLVSSRWIRH
jgi:hypothetical protein